MPSLNSLKKIFTLSGKKSNNSKKINSKIINIKNKIIYVFIDDSEIKELFDDYSINTNYTIKIEKKGDEINFNIKKIKRIDNSVIASRINNNINDINNNTNNNKNNKKINEIKEKLKMIKDNIIIYIKPLKVIKNNISNKNNVDYIFLKNKKNNFENDLKSKIKYLKSDNIFSEIVKVINLPPKNNNIINKNNINNRNKKDNFCNIDNKIGYKLENKSGLHQEFINNTNKNFSSTWHKVCNEKCSKENPIILNFRNENQLKQVQTYLYPFYLGSKNLLNIISFNSLNIYKRNTKIRFIENGIYKYEYKNEIPLINIKSNEDIKKYKLIYLKEKKNNKNEYYFILTKNDDSTIYYKINMSDILYFILINNKKDVIIILKKCAKLLQK